MIEQLSRAPGTTKQSKLDTSGCELSGDVLKRLSYALLRTDLGVKRQDVDLWIASQDP